jgi:NAD(P)H-nitrite reductase large subunit/ferredoxin
MTDDAPHVADNLLPAAEAVHAGEISVSFENGPTVRAKVGDALLDIAEASQVPIESGCRMGMCGSDPVRILEGEENLSAMRSAERRTLDRLGLAGCRMACVARVQGPVSLRVHPSLDDEAAQSTAVDDRPAGRTFRDSIRRVVVVGTGVAGVTAAEELRKVLPDASLVLVGEEPYDFYNRMAITRLVSESISIDSLYLNRRDWAESRRIDYRRGVAVVAIDRTRSEVETETGERFPYDRLVLATGSRPFIPAIEGFGVAGSFALRTIDDAVQIQQYIRARRCESAVVVGAGLLGLESAYNIAQLGVRVSVLDRGPWPLSRQLDEHAGSILWQMLHDLGIEILASAEARRLLVGGQVSGIELLDGRSIPAQLALVTTGVEPNVHLARAAGLAVAVGVSVNDAMRSSDPNVFAVGDVADHGGRCHGLWPASVDQAHVAVQSLVGGEAAFEASIPPARLKVPGIDLLSVGAIHALGRDAHTVVLTDHGSRGYRKLVVEDGRVAGAIVLGSPELFDDVTRAVEVRLEVGADLDALDHGDWSSLSRAA